MKKILVIVGGVVVLISLVIASWFVLHNSIIFHTDIARDFLLLQDVLTTKKPALIGPRSGGIPGVFHGPLWLYLNLPAYIIGHGDPVVVGWFWVLLFLSTLYIVYRATIAIFGKEAALIAVVLTALGTAEAVSSLYNPYGALMLAPLVIFFLWRYLKKRHGWDLFWGLLTLGLTVQFQMAFGVPLIVLMIPLLGYIIVKHKKFVHFLIFSVLALPLSTFILFDVRHQFLQTKSVLRFLTGAENTGKLHLTLTQLIGSRLDGFLLGGASHFTRGILPVSILFFALILSALVAFVRHKGKKADMSWYYLFLYLYGGFWFLTLFFGGTIWSYYYWPFLPVIAIGFASLVKVVDRRLFYACFAVLVAVNMSVFFRQSSREPGFYRNDTSSWGLYEEQAKKIFTDAPAEFGYYIFTADQFGYSSRYGMDYMRQYFKTKKSYPFQKKHTTYVIIFPSTNIYISELWWKENKVMIPKSRKPDEVFSYKGSYIEKYVFTPEEEAVASDPNLIHDLIFR